MKLFPRIQRLFFEGISLTLVIVFVFSSLAAQKLKIVETQKPEPEGFNLGYVLILGLGIALGGAIFWWLNWRKGDEPNEAKNPPPKPKKKGPNPVKKSQKNLVPKTKSLNQEDFDKFELAEAEKYKIDSLLPIFSITEIEPTKTIPQLPLSNEPSLLSAIEHVNEELEEDEEMRLVSLRVLAAFKNRNSVEAITQVALYDISANLRAKAVTALSEFDHPSVFETILLACADPTREVRAAAARGLSRLSFERSEAWLRLAETQDVGILRHAARAIIAGDLVQRSIERLIHTNQEYAFEAFAVVVLLIKAGETDEILAARLEHKNKTIGKAITHIIALVGETRLLEK